MEKLSSGFVMIECKQKSLDEIINQLNEIDIVKEFILVEGLWKIIVRLEAKNLDDIRESVRWKIRKMIGIKSTLTLIEHIT